VPKISSDTFNEFLGQVVLKNICVWEATIARQGDSKAGEREFRFGERTELVFADKGNAIIHATYGVLEFEGDEEVMRLEVTMRAAYQTPRTMNPEIFDEFRKITLRLHTIPFAREWFRDASGRMGIEPILLPLAIAHPAAFSREMAVKAPKTAKSAKPVGEATKSANGGR